MKILKHFATNTQTKTTEIIGERIRQLPYRLTEEPHCVCSFCNKPVLVYKPEMFLKSQNNPTSEAYIWSGIKTKKLLN